MRDLICQNRICRKCRRSLHFDEFSPDPKGWDGLSTTCRSCSVSWDPIRRHGITALEKEAIAEAQDGCAICGRLVPSARGWTVDHDHSCCPGERSCPSCRRGVLCHWCNATLGYAGDDPAVLRRMADYLELGTRLNIRTGSEPDDRIGSPLATPTDPEDKTDGTDGAVQDVGLSGSFAERVRAPRNDSRRRVG